MTISTGSVAGVAVHRTSDPRAAGMGNVPADAVSAATPEQVTGHRARSVSGHHVVVPHRQTGEDPRYERVRRSSSPPTARETLRTPATSHEAGGYRISGFTREDAADIPRAFETVYGEDYLNPLVYDVEGFAALVASGKQISFVARDAHGSLAGHLALTFPAPNRRLVEVSQGIVLPAHRKSGIFARMMDRAIEFARDELGAQAVFGEALTNHTVSQRVLAACGFRPVGLEMDYVPQRMLLRERASGPAATLIQYLDLGGEAYVPCHLPPAHAAWFARLLEGAAISGPRELALAIRAGHRASITEPVDMPRCDMSRLVVRRAGSDLWRVLDAQESEARAAGRRSFQVLVNLGNVEGAVTVELLSACGYACGGLIPGFFENGEHAAIMYRSFEQPYFEGAKMHDRDGEQLLARVLADWQRVERRGTAPDAGTAGDPVRTVVRTAPASVRVDSCLDGERVIQAGGAAG